MQRTLMVAAFVTLGWVVACSDDSSGTRSPGGDADGQADVAADAPQDEGPADQRGDVDEDAVADAFADSGADVVDSASDDVDDGDVTGIDESIEDGADGGADGADANDDAAADTADAGDGSDSADAGDPDVATDVTGEPDAAPGVCEAQIGGEGACVNAEDCAIIDDGLIVIYAATLNCSSDCGEGEVECIQSCLADETGISSDCSGCITAFLACVLGNCNIPACLSPASSLCVECLDGASCTTSFTTCAGFDAIEAFQAN